MATNPSNRNDSTFVTPNPEGLQSEENRAEVQQRIQEQNPLTDRNSDASSQPDDVSGAPDFNPDDINQSGEDANVFDSEPDAENVFNRQIGSAFRSGS
jgi:hypothetical protein